MAEDAVPPPPAPPQRQITPSVRMTPQLEKKKKTHGIQFDSSLLRPPLATARSTSASGDQRPGATSSAAAAAAAVEALTIDGKRKAVPIASKTFRTSNANMPPVSKSGPYRLGSNGGLQPSDNPNKLSKLYTRELEALVSSISDTLTNPEHVYGGTTGTQQRRRIANVNFEPRGCSWNFIVEAPAPERGADSSQFKIRIVCSAVTEHIASGKDHSKIIEEDEDFDEDAAPKNPDEKKEEVDEDDEVVGYLFDMAYLPDEEDEEYDEDGILASNSHDEDAVAFNKQIFDEIGLEVKKALVRCEFPEFPEGCKGRAFRDVYQLNARLKSGSFATVCRGTHRETGKKVAIKCVLRKDLPPSDDAAIYDEVAILSSLRHRYVCPLIDFFEEKECYFLVMELMTGGDLFDRIGKKKLYTEKDARDLCRKMLEAMQYCHAKNIAHCDMKPKNLLLKSEDDDSFIKLADFGFAARVHSPKTLTKQCGTPFFVAPEILMRVPYDQASDMWSVGCIIYLLLGGNLPFMGRSQRELFRKIVVGKYDFPEDCWSHVSEDAKELVRKLLVTDPDRRMTASDALRSKWIRESAMRLQKHNLMFTSQRLKTFNARMKLRSAMIAVDWVSSMSRSSVWKKAASVSEGSDKNKANAAPTTSLGRQASIKEEDQTAETPDGKNTAAPNTKSETAPAVISETAPEGKGETAAESQ